MTTYRVTATFSEKELLNFINVNGSVGVKIEAVRDPDTESPYGFDSPIQAAARRRPMAAKATRRKRGSKVFEAILDRLSKGEAVAADLRSSLEAAGLSPTSLSTGLALLQKNGKIRRGAEGSYTLADAA